MGRDSADVLMDLLPPVGWADIATKQDLDHLERRLDATFEGLTYQITAGDDRVLAALRKDPNSMVLKLFALVVGLVTAVAAIVVTLVAFA